MEYAMIRLLTVLALLFLPIIHSSHVITVTGQAEWERGFGPVTNRAFALLEVTSENPPTFRHNSKSPQARTDAQGRFAFRAVADGKYVLSIEDRPPFGWAPVWRGTVMYLVVVEGESVEMGMVRVGKGHLWGK